MSLLDTINEKKTMDYNRLDRLCYVYQVQYKTITEHINRYIIYVSYDEFHLPSTIIPLIYITSDEEVKIYCELLTELSESNIGHLYGIGIEDSTKLYINQCVLK